MKKVPTRQRGQRVRLLAALAFCLLLAAGAAQAIGPRDQQGPVPVTVSIVQEADVAEAEFVGRIEAIEHVDVRARVEGFLQSLNFARATT